MAVILYADRVQETTTTTGTGTVTLAGAVSGFQTFSSVMTTGQSVFYCITSGTAWETGVGVYTTSGTTLSRVTVFESSSSGSLITLSGTSNVFLTLPAIAIADVGVTAAFSMHIVPQ
jgi:hypothetical protein